MNDVEEEERRRIAHELHFALVRGTPDRTTPTLVRVQVENGLAAWWKLLNE